MDQQSDRAIDRYQSRWDQLQATLADLDRRDRRIGHVRVGLFLVVLTCGFLAAFAQSSTVFVIAGALFFAMFLAAVIYNEPIRDAIEHHQQQQRVLDRAMARVRRDWVKLEKLSPKVTTADLDLDDHAISTATDLDLFGRASLFRWLSMTETAMGNRALASWLVGRADADVAKARTECAQVLAKQRDERIEFHCLAHQVSQMSGDPEAFQHWATGPSWLSSCRWLYAYANVSLLIALSGGLLLLTGWVFASSGDLAKYGAIVLFALAVLNTLLGALLLAPVHQILSVALTSRRSVASYAAMFEHAKWLPGGNDASPLAMSIRARVLDGPRSAKQGMHDLSLIARAGALKQSAATFLLYLPLQLFGLWDVRVLRRLEHWQQNYGNACRDWFDALGDLEALMSVAAVCDEQSEWTFPHWQSSADKQVSATRLGHPLLDDQHRVCNDVTVGPAGTFLLVTGSNMSGKSTLLRSIGLNVVLAATGAPVCATYFALPTLELGTSIRVTDSLAEGVSFYMAELYRLRSVVEQAERLAKSGDCTLLFLLDEILQGTNSRERQIAVATVLQRLVDCQAIGAISTHDLELAEDPGLTEKASTVHFRETIQTTNDGQEEMTFDYKMRQGVSPTTNALRLLEIVGLGRGGAAEKS
ncbi:MutS family DNA mismatch repair protein [Crateriforma conspicua]|uniref:DNA mismatch repair protein MutS n=1 Tax=Crateriforma conspicua TaxID=2527996 RepID=A0A5C6FSF7_9PLAN|nr:MutS family DNA mismatch repair protein [Crateriforma conspicua]TWU63436.1 DNA mismatch repair protein MutS [Crateriforma conspicua]